EQYFPQFWLFGGLATAMWAERRLRDDSDVAPVSAPAVATRTPTYDPGVSDRRTEERERRVRVQFEAIRAQQERLRRLSENVRAREERLEREREELQRAQREH